MPLTSNPVSTDAKTSASGLRLVVASGLSLPPPSPARAVPVPTETVTLHAKPDALSNEAQAEISRLKARDTQVHQHEQAHLSAAAGLDVSNASFTYQRGPNGVNYAVAGEVKIDTSPGRTPEETLAKAEKIRDTALAPADPSAVDRSVAAKAQHMVMEARAELMHNHAIEQHGEQKLKHAYDIGKSESPPSPLINTYA
jgi:hypothetical protein